MIHAIVAAAMSAHMLVPAPTPLAARVVEHPAAQTQPGGAASGPPPAAAQLNFEVYRAQVEPLFLVKREGSARCVDCHAPGAGTLRLQVLAPGTYTWTEEQSQELRGSGPLRRARHAQGQPASSSSARA